nr:MAG TPA: hypothetical protein [Myoviridae sp. ct3tv2]
MTNNLFFCLVHNSILYILQECIIFYNTLILR